MSSEPENKTSVNGYRLPETNTLQHACKLSIVEDKPIIMDYWTTSLDKTSSILPLPISLTNFSSQLL